MKITATMALRIFDGQKTVDIVPGVRDYKLDHKDPQIAEQLRVHRKHRRISFSELLACDVNPETPEVNNPVELKASPAGKRVKKVKDGADKAPKKHPVAAPKKAANKSDGGVPDKA